MQVSIREDLGGVGMWRHREDLIKRADHILGQLDRGLGYLARHKQDFRRPNIYRAEGQYEELKRVLLEVHGGVMNTLTRTPPKLILFDLLTPPDAYRIPLDLRVRSAAPVSIISHPENLASLPLTSRFVCTLAPGIVIPFPHTIHVAFMLQSQFARMHVHRPGLPDGQWTSRGSFWDTTLVVAVPELLVLCSGPISSLCVGL